MRCMRRGGSIDADGSGSTGSPKKRRTIMKSDRKRREAEGWYSLLTDILYQDGRSALEGVDYVRGMAPLKMTASDILDVVEQVIIAREEKYADDIGEFDYIGREFDDN